MQKKIAKIALLAVAIIWGTGFVASALALENFSPNEILFIRFGLAFLFLLAGHVKKLRTMRVNDLFKGSIIGLFLYLAFLFQTIGLQYTTPSKNAFLTSANIVIVPFITIFLLKKRVPGKVLFGTLITLTGIGFISLNEGFNQINRGDIYTLICAIFFALQIVLTDCFVTDIDTETLILAEMGAASLTAWVVLKIDTGFQGMQLFKETSIEAFLPVIYLGLVSTLLAYYLQTFAQKRTTGSEAAIILSTEAFFGMISSVIFLHEHITLNMLIGAALIFFGIIIVEVEPKKTRMNLEKVK